MYARLSSSYDDGNQYLKSWELNFYLQKEPHYLLSACRSTVTSPREMDGLDLCPE